MRGADEGSPAPDIGKMLDKQGSLAREKLYEDQAEARCVFNGGLERDERNLEHRHGRDCRDGVIAVTVRRSQPQKIAPHGKVDDLPLAAGQIAIDTSPAGTNEMKASDLFSLPDDRGIGGKVAFDNGERRKRVYLPRSELGENWRGLQ